MDHEQILKERKEKIFNLFKQKRDWIYYLILSFIVLVSIYIRSRNIPRLKDITTGSWTLGPDLDPFLFLRWAKHIVENGSLMIHDSMRNVPLGFNTSAEMKLLSYLIAWFHNFLSFFSNEVTVTYSAIIFPVFMFALTAIAFFLFSRKIFYKEKKQTRNIIALIATAFFVVIPSLLPRTIAGIPEKESAAFFFMFMAFYLFLEAFNSKKLKNKIGFGIASGVATGLMALIWGGFIFIFFTIPTAILLAFVIGIVKRKELMVYASWLITSFVVMMPFSTRYNFENLIMSTSTGLGIGVLVLIGMGLIIIKSKNAKLEQIRKRTKLPPELFSLIISILVLIVAVLIVLGPSFVIEKVTHVKNSLITPMTTRFGLTVAENKQPFFADDWKNSFGPIKFNIPLFFWLFFIGSVTLFSHLIGKLNSKERIILLAGYVVFLLSLIFSRYSPNSILNGTSDLSLIVYFGGWILFLGSFGYIYYKVYHERGNSVFRNFNFNYILYFLILTLGIIGARGGIRLIMVLGAVSPIAVAFLIVKTSERYFKEKEETMKVMMGIIVLIILLASIFTLWTYYKHDKFSAENFAPGVYQFQWQNAMNWVRENTSEDAVFAHWWDYGYWLQSIGERATILDGGNVIVYWNHLMGRYVLTGTDEQKSLEFLYTHDGTHLLIDSTEIGKYTAYSSIGSDKDYDRFSWINTFLMDERQTQETNNETTYVYPGGTMLDEDILWEENGNNIFLPRGAAGLGGILIKETSTGEILQPIGIFVYNGNQYQIPLRYMYLNNTLKDYGTGLDSGIFLFPSLVTSTDGQMRINDMGTLFYLSKRTIHSQMVELYLFDKKSDYFTLVHTEENFIINNLRNQNIKIGDFIYYQGFQGPIKIWEVSYPQDIKSNPEYLEKEYPSEDIRLATPGQYN